MAGVPSVESFLGRAFDFLIGMQLTKDDPAYRNSAALLAIHSGIAYSDALRTGLGDTSLSSENHTKSIDSLRRLLYQRNVKAEAGLRQLQTLLSYKSAIAYGSTRIEDASYALLFQSAERYSAWANRLGAEMVLQGWRSI